MASPCRLVGRWKKQKIIQLKSGEAFEPGPAPHFLVYLQCKEHVLGGKIDFLVDTGADLTTIMPDDRETVCIPDRVLRDGCPPGMRGIGGIVAIRYLHDVTFQFCGVGGSILKPLHIERIGILCPLKKFRSAYKGAPSLLGRDFLKRCRVDLSDAGVFLDWSG
jgi:hypothetical protein